jgi:hypothetical protein
LGTKELFGFLPCLATAYTKYTQKGTSPAVAARHPRWYQKAQLTQFDGGQEGPT